MLMPGRHANTGDYRYGFNGKEMDDEVKGEGNQYDYGFRIYDPRIGKFLSTDPLFRGYPYYTPYQFAGNKPIWAVDLDGLEEYTKTSSRQYSIDYIINSTGEILEGSFTFYSQSDQKTMTIVSGLKRMDVEGEEGGSVFITKSWYIKTDMATKDGLRRYRLVDRKYYGTGEFVPPNPSDNRRPIDDVEPIKTKPVLKLQTEVKVHKKISHKTEPQPQPSTEKEQPKDILKVEKLSLKVDFVANRKKFENDKQVSKVLTPILEKLKMSPNNFVRLSPNTLYNKDQDILDLWGWSADADTSNELVKKRGETITKWFTDRGVNASQVIIDTSNSYNKSIDVTGELTTFEKEKNK